MKRLLIAIAAALICVSSAAQIVNVEKTSKANNICSFRLGYCSFEETNNVFSLVLNSTNELDDHVIFRLGLGKESAEKTMVDIIGLVKSMANRETAKFTIVVGLHQYDYEISKINSNRFEFLNYDILGHVVLTISELNFLIPKLKAYGTE